MTLKKAIKKCLGLFEIINQAGTYSFTIHLLRSLYTVLLVFYMFMFKLATSNTFPSWSEFPLLLVVIDSKSEYEIFSIVNSKIDCRYMCKLLYKVIWLENMKEESDWLLVSELTYTFNIIFNLWQTYPDKLSLFLLP